MSRNGHSRGFRAMDDAMPLRPMSRNVICTPAKKRTGNADGSNLQEQETFLDRSSVKLFPQYEAYSADEIRFKIPRKDHKDRFGSSEKTPPDRLNLVFFVIMLHGIGILMPWNMFITAESYFVEYKLNVDNNSTQEYKKNFLSYVGVAAQVPNVLCSALNILMQFGSESLTYRIIGSVLIEISVFIATIFLAMLDSSSWPGTFFYITMASVVVINMANGIYQNSVYGLASKLPAKYPMAVVIGSNISGTLTSLILILSLAASPNLRTAAIYYFITAVFVLLACIDTYMALPLMKFYRYYTRITQKAITESGMNARKPPFLKIFWKAAPQCLNVFCVFFVTLTLFPAIQANVKQIDPEFLIPPKYFSPIACFLNFNFFSMVGSFVPNYIKFPGPRFLWIPVLLRFLMIPYFMLCNFIPDRRQIPVFITNDWAFIGMGVVMAFTNGYYSSLAMMYAPASVDKNHAQVAGQMAAFFLVLGIVCGVNFSFFISWLVEMNLF